MKYLISSVLLLLSNIAFGQSTRRLVKDFDHDFIKDTVYIDSDKDILVCLLSRDKFRKVESDEIRYLRFGNTLVSTKKGFEFWNEANHSSFISVFEYNKKANKMQLVQMKRTDYGSRADYPDEKRGVSSVNLLTNLYIGEFSRMQNKKMVKVPTIYAKMIYPIIYLETYTDAMNFNYEGRCNALYKKQMEKRQQLSPAQ